MWLQVRVMSKAAEAARRKAVESAVRRSAGLLPEQALHPDGATAAEVFAKQAAAVARLRDLVERGVYSERQLGCFAQEVGDGGVRQFLVDTFAGFVATYAPEFDPHSSFSSFSSPQEPPRQPPHLYEVILDRRPCWLYFDLEFSTEANPNADNARVAEAFRETLASFCKDVLGATLDWSSVLEMDSSTPAKFSMHVVAKHLRRESGTEQPGPAGDASGNSAAAEGDENPSLLHLAFANNAQAGLLVRELIAYARARRHQPGSPSHFLFLSSPQTLGPLACGAATDKVGAGTREVSLIDESVYSRNRCFRLLYNSKFGKRAALRLAARGEGQTRAHPAQCMLATMASFVPADVPLFNHALIPLDFGHVELLSSRPRDGGAPRPCGEHQDIAEVHSGLLQHLIDTWDRVRLANEGLKNANIGRSTSVQACVHVGETGRFVIVTLQNNRFCLCKGASHKSNSIYLVVDQDSRTFHQKCHDTADCGRWFKSQPFGIPEVLCEDAEERELWRALPALEGPLPKKARQGCEAAASAVAAEAARPQHRGREPFASIAGGEC